MKYRCWRCGRGFDEEDVVVRKEGRGECFGEESFEKVYCCPVCNGDDFAEIEACSICGEEHFADELFSGVCDDCIDKCRHDFDTCAKICGSEKEERRINALIASLLDDDDIEAILYHYIKEKCQGIDCSAFIDADTSWFAERLAKEVKKDENGKD